MNTPCWVRYGFGRNLHKSGFGHADVSLKRSKMGWEHAQIYQEFWEKSMYICCGVGWVIDWMSIWSWNRPIMIFRCWSCWLQHFFLAWMELKGLATLFFDVLFSNSGNLWWQKKQLTHESAPTHLWKKLLCISWEVFPMLPCGSLMVFYGFFFFQYLQ